MPRKIRDVEADLRKAGFVEYPRKGKGSHRSFEHPLAPDYPVYVAGHPGDDAKRYLEKQAAEALEVVGAREKQGR